MAGGIREVWLLKMDFNPSVPIYIQIIELIKRQLVSGERQAGSRVETVREMAQQLGVNPNTIQKTFAELEREGLMYTERTAGRYITADAQKIGKIREESVARDVRDFVGKMRGAGFGREEILALVARCIGEAEQGER